MQQAEPAARKRALNQWLSVISKSKSFLLAGKAAKLRRTESRRKPVCRKPATGRGPSGKPARRRAPQRTASRRAAARRRASQQTEADSS